MKMQDLKIKTEKELADTLVSFKKEQMNLRFQKASGELKNLSRFKVVRRAIARIKTLMNQMNKKESN